MQAIWAIIDDIFLHPSNLRRRHFPRLKRRRIDCLQKLSHLITKAKKSAIANVYLVSNRERLLCLFTYYRLAICHLDIVSNIAAAYVTNIVRKPAKYGSKQYVLLQILAD